MNPVVGQKRWLISINQEYALLDYRNHQYNRLKRSECPQNCEIKERVWRKRDHIPNCSRKTHFQSQNTKENEGNLVDNSATSTSVSFPLLL